MFVTALPGVKKQMRKGGGRGGGSFLTPERAALASYIPLAHIHHLPK